MLAALIYGPLVARTFGIAQPEQVILVITALIVVGWLIARWHPVRQFVMILPLFLVVHPILEAIVAPSVTAQAAPPAGDLPSLEDADSPNVYWVVVDGYGREDVLQELGSTSDLAAGLRGRGFEVDPEAVVPYAWTHLSLGATLSAAYFPQNLTYRELKPVADELFRRGPPAFRAFESAGFSRLLWPGVDWPGFTCEPIDPACLRTLSLAPEDALVSGPSVGRHTIADS